MSEAERVDGASLAREFLAHSPFAQLVGLALESLEPDRAELRLPFDSKLATTGEVVHGGAIATLVDTAATAAAWSAEFERMPRRWGTASIHVTYERPAVGHDLQAVAVVTRRGGNLSFCQVEVTAAGERIASGTVVYTLAA